MKHELLNITAIKEIGTSIKEIHELLIRIQYALDILIKET